MSQANGFALIDASGNPLLGTSDQIGIRWNIANRQWEFGTIGSGNTSDDIANESAVAGATVTAALDSLNNDIATPIFTDPTPRNATQTLVVGNGSRVLITSLASDITLTLGVAGATANEGLIIERRDTSAFQVTVINGGPAGAGGPVGGPNLYVFPGSVQRSSSFLFDASDWSAGANIRIDAP